MSNSHFAKVPNIEIPRSRFKQTFQHRTSFQFSKLIPLDCFEIIPGDEFKCDISSLIRMNTPIAPIMSNISCKILAFYCPTRLLFDNTREFYGENTSGEGPQLGNYKIPQYNIKQYTIPVDSVAAYLGKPAVTYQSDFASNPLMISPLKERMYYLIYNEWFRAQQVMKPFIVNTTSSSPQTIYSRNGVTYNVSTAKVLSVCKEFDYLTSGTISPQYGPSVTLPLGSFAPIISNGDLKFIGANDTGNGTALYADGNQYDSGAKTLVGIQNPGAGVSPSGALQYKGGLLADLRNATAASINQIRYAFQLQKYFERSNFGSRFYEMLQVHYGVTSPDSRLQRPEYLGATQFYINIDQVLSTAGYAAGTTTEVGQPGAVSITANKTNLFTKGFIEPGYVMILLETKQDHTYAQGVNREDLKSDRFEFYTPEFANLGDQETKKVELYWNAANSADTFNFQEAWAEYRFRKSLTTGMLNPERTGSLDYWTLTDKYNSEPSFDETWILENRDNISRALTTGASSPFDFIGDFFFTYTATREMPVYTIPGLVDHFGVM